MTFSLDFRIRAALYILTALGTPLVAYLNARGWIGELEVALWSAEVAVIMGMAGLYVSDDSTLPPITGTNVK